MLIVLKQNTQKSIKIEWYNRKGTVHDHRMTGKRSNLHHGLLTEVLLYPGIFKCMWSQLVAIQAAHWFKFWMLLNCDPIYPNQSGGCRVDCHKSSTKTRVILLSKVHIRINSADYLSKSCSAWTFFDKNCNRSIPFPCHDFCFFVFFLYKSVRREIENQISHVQESFLTTLVASAFTSPARPATCFTTRTSESASVYDGICEAEQRCFTLCSLLPMLTKPDEQQWGACGQKQLGDPCTTQFSCCHALKIMPLQREAMYCTLHVCPATFKKYLWLQKKKKRETCFIHALSPSMHLSGSLPQRACYELAAELQASMRGLPLP